MGFSRKKNCNLPVPGGRVKVVGIPGVNQKLRKKHGFPGGSTPKKSISSTGGYNYFLEKPNSYLFFFFFNFHSMLIFL